MGNRLNLQERTLDIVRMYCLPEELPEAASFCLDGPERLSGVKVAPPELDGYGELLREEGVA